MCPEPFTTVMNTTKTEKQKRKLYFLCACTCGNSDECVSKLSSEPLEALAFTPGVDKQAVMYSGCVDCCVESAEIRFSWDPVCLPMTCWGGL